MKSFPKPLVKTFRNYVLTGMFLLAFITINAQNIKVQPLEKSEVKEAMIFESPSHASGIQKLPIGNETLNRSTKYSIKKSIESIGETEKASRQNISNKLPFQPVKK